MNHSGAASIRISPIQGSADELRRAVAHVLHAEKDATVSNIIRAITPLPAVRTAAVGSYASEDAAWGVWHAGADYLMYAVGAESLLDHCELTQTEREQLMLQIRRASTYGESVLVVVSHHSASMPAGLPKRIDCLGLIFYR